jgi:hypothetical protein
MGDDSAALDEQAQHAFSREHLDRFRHRRARDADALAQLRSRSSGSLSTGRSSSLRTSGLDRKREAGPSAGIMAWPTARPSFSFPGTTASTSGACGQSGFLHTLPIVMPAISRLTKSGRSMNRMAAGYTSHISPRLRKGSIRPGGCAAARLYA